MSEPHKRDEKHWFTHSEAFKIDYSTYAQEHFFLISQPQPEVTSCHAGSVPRFWIYKSTSKVKKKSNVPKLIT
jgi:hypothetical protein